MNRYLGELDAVRLEDDGPDGLYLRLELASGVEITARVTDMQQLVSEVEPLRRHLRDGEAVRRERELWLARGGADDPAAPEAQADDGEAFRAWADYARKAWKESAA